MKFDGLPNDKTIGIEQLQIEQDTGRSLYRLDGISNIDFNRSNIPLVEMVTAPDFENVEEVRAFIKKFQHMLVNLDVCTGELETGSIRVDVNVSIDKHARIEIKNLPTTSAIINAIRYEYKRQCKIVNRGGKIDSIETRGWNGKTTYKLRSKEDSIDYRYMPDPELPLVKLNLNDIIPKVKANMPVTIEEKMKELIDGEYKLKLRDANVLMNDPELLAYYKTFYEKCKQQGLKNPINWVVHELMGSLTKSNMTFSKVIVDAFSEQSRRSKG
ncbi:unnamed protein product [Ambrosiozyma monospora]|uniref:Unnamed protein product n=1 Tax=Ambrosiozyma monospora TaxID=43982 RepID=A0ACB5U9V1_AMBMO|nr:unnamed protein product [Ambrosiozyma monospora]